MSQECSLAGAKEQKLKLMLSLLMIKKKRLMGGESK